MITDRDIAVLTSVARYFVLKREQIQRLCFPGDTSGRLTRRRLQKLVAEGYLNRTQMQVVNPHSGAPCPVYYPSQKGAEFLAAHAGDARYLALTTQCPQAHHLNHWLAVSETHITLDEALARQEEVMLRDWINEWDTVNKDEVQPAKRYQLYTVLKNHPRLICVPDAAFLLEVRGYRKAFYLEQDRATSGVRHVASSKAPGYAELARQRLHRVRHFPSANVDPFTVLLIAPTRGRRDLLRSAIAGKPGADLWKFASAEELRAETFLSAPIWYPCTGVPVPLIKGTTREGNGKLSNHQEEREACQV